MAGQGDQVYPDPLQFQFETSSTLCRKREVSRESSDILRGTEVEQGAVVGHFDG